MSRPQGSNADEWAVFLSEHDGPDFRSYVAVQIAVAIEERDKILADLVDATDAGTSLADERKRMPSIIAAAKAIIAAGEGWSDQ